MVPEVFDGDLENLSFIATHEAFHSLQALLAPPEFLEEINGENTTFANTWFLMLSTLWEGSALYVANPLRMGRETESQAKLYERMERGLGEIERNFDLLDTLLFRAFNDQDAVGEELYALGFYNYEFLYYAGYVMTKAIIDDQGLEEFAEYFKKPPVQFFIAYKALYEKNPDLPRFSPSTEKIIKDLAKF